MDYKRLKKLLNHIVIIGKTKKTLFKKSIDFELQVYYTSVKNKIMVIDIDGVELGNPRLYIEFTIGDDIQLVYDWVEKNGHEIVFQRNRL